MDFSFFKSFNWVDGIIILVLLFYSVEGYALGVVSAFFDLLKFVVSFLAGLKFYFLASNFLTLIFHLSRGYANAIGFFLIAFVVEIVLQIVLQNIIKIVNKKSIFGQSNLKKIGNFLGILPGLLSGTILLMFLLTIISSLPVSTYLKNAMNASRLATFLIVRSQVVERELASIFGGAANDTLNFLTIEPSSNAVVPLDFQTSKGTVDSQAENQMLAMVNTERTNRAEQSLSVDPQLQQLAREYANYMLVHGYFSHYTPEGLSPFDRMSQKGIVFTYAGENLAFSPNVQLAMQGLMNSPGHRANILSTNFKRVGIGVVDAGIYGEMFVQEFTD